MPGDAVLATQVEIKLKHSLNQILLLNQSLVSSRSTSRPEQVFEVLCYELVKALNITYVAFRLLQTGDTRAEILLETKNSALPAAPNPLAVRAVSEAVEAILKNPRPVLLSAIESLPEQSLWIIPLADLDGIGGILYLQSCGQGHLSEEEIFLAEYAALTAGQVYKNACLYNAMERELYLRKQIDERQTLIHEVLKAVSGQLNTGTVAQMAVDAIVEFTDWPHVCFAVIDDDNIHWVIRGAGGRLAAALGTTGLLSRGVIGRVFRTNQFQCVANTSADPDYVCEVASENQPAGVLDDTVLRSELAVPLRRGERLLGVLNLESNQLAAFSPEDIQLAQSLADAIALALDNAQLYEEAQQDLAERKQVEQKLVYQSIHDHLTGLYNRTHFEEQLTRLGGGEHFPVSLIMIDLDKFKQINDTLGHSAGDECLKTTAHVLQGAFRPEDIVARIGGDEFAVILSNTDEETAQQKIECLMQHWNHHFPHGSLFFNLVSMSIGLATAVPGEKLFNVLRRADKKMYEAKFNKRAQ